MSQTRLQPVPLVPEVRVYTATELSPLCAATQSALDFQDLELPFWAFPWAGGQALARYVLDHPSVVRGARIIDFAAGNGLVGIAAAMSGASRVSCTDIDPLACSATRLNARAATVRVATTKRDLVGRRVRPELLLVGDVFYDRHAATRFLPWLRERARTGVRVLVGDPGRPHFPAASMQLVATYDVPASHDGERDGATPCGVFELVPG